MPAQGCREDFLSRGTTRRHSAIGLVTMTHWQAVACYMLFAHGFMPDEQKIKKVTYLGSGAFAISKPKRSTAKLRRSRLKKPQRRARK